MHPQPQPGSLIADRYRLVREIGRGGMGVVLEAENITTERRVALKWLHPDLAKNPETAQRLVREATATCRIRHPNVVDVYDVVRDGEGVYLVMELLEGEPLEQLLERGGMPLHELIALLIPAMRGVAEAHRLGIIHRDIHPANIFLARRGRDSRPTPKVLDFGISKIGGDAPSLTRSGITLGTPLYMSYEQLRSSRDVDKRTDVYSFGVILYEALTGQPPFRGEMFAELAFKISTGTPLPPRQLQPALPAELDRIICQAIARDREDRIPDLETLIDALEPFASEQPFRALMTGADRRIPTVPPRARDSEAREALHPDAAVEAAGTPLDQSAVHAHRALKSAAPPARKPALRYALAALTLVLLVLGWFMRPRSDRRVEQTSFGAASASAPEPAAPAASVIETAAPSAPPPKPAAVEPIAPAARIAPSAPLAPSAKPALAKPAPARPANDRFRAGHAYRKDFE